jgi:drug/metabolite transporter (DMT)-like permease
MHWSLYATLSLLLVGTFNTMLEGSKQTMSADVITKSMYTSSILVCAGVISALSLLYHRHYHKVEYRRFYKVPRMSHVIFPACCLCSYLVTNTLALSGGGGVAMGIINLNMIVTLLAGSYFYNDRINLKIICSMLIGVMSLNFAVYESSKIN